MKIKPLLSFIVLTFLSLVSCSNIRNPENKKVGILPLQSFPENAIDSVKSEIQQCYGFDVFILPTHSLPKSSIINIKGKRYRADSLLIFLRNIKSDSLDYLMALTEKDISVTVRNEEGEVKEPYRKYYDWGVFGYGYQPGLACIISSYRLDRGHPKFYERLKKVALHELGHNLGLPHCPKHGCLMNNANEKLATIDLEKLSLCSNCKGIIGK